jgi:hypothetical protein
MKPVLSEGVGAVFGTSVFLQLIIIKDGSTELFRDNIDSKGGGDPALLYNIEHHFQGQYTFTLPLGARCILYMSAGPGPFRDLIFYHYDSEGGKFAIEYDYRLAPTRTVGIRPSVLAPKFPPRYLLAITTGWWPWLAIGCGKLLAPNCARRCRISFLLIM